MQLAIFKSNIPYILYSINFYSLLKHNVTSIKRYIQWNYDLA